MTTMLTTDVAIIGAGPVGLFSVFECGMMGLKTHVIDSLNIIGGQCTALYPEKPIYDIPAYPKILGVDLINNLKEQIAPFNPQYHLEQNVEKIFKKGDIWSLKTSKKTLINARALIIAAGVGSFKPKRPPIKNIKNYENKSIFYFIKKRSYFTNKRVVIAGGGDSAIDWAISLSKIAKSINIVHRRNKFRAAPENLNKMEKLVAYGKIKLIVPYQLQGLRGNGKNLTGVIVQDFNGKKRTLDADILLPFYGLNTKLGFINTWGIKNEDGHIPVQPTNCQTQIPGIFAIGDIAVYEGKKKLILTGFSEAVQAAYAIRSLIYPNKTFRFKYSTIQGIPFGCT